MKATKKMNPYDLSSVAKHTRKSNKINISSLRSPDINSAGGKNSSFITKHQSSVSKKSN